ncbi:AIPR family protein [Lusitaniella coriacea LEGE 07157]|uniref:AIPR family protein n=1 Tax=Lusitaniella coriacea LEGE 07157 TaxID=945747 RepID=A0A8J7JFA7_9CYAN|nr:AIPR family protein [Lusitaniella coriacea]MBE9118635.1 AIPR family protein [Lusitaniella coriacea LEGE 07157]
MSDQLSTFHIKQVEAELDGLFAELIDMTDYAEKKANEKQLAFRSRALAAYSLHILAEASPSQASDAVVDGYDDNGIDALLFQKKQNTLWLVQSKWIKNGKSTPKAGEMRSFKDGIFDLLNFSIHKHERFNEKFEYKEEDINSALNSPGLKIKVIIAHTGSKLARHSRDVLDDLIEGLNDGEEIASLEEFNLEKAFKAVYERNNPEDIEVRFKLSHWGMIVEPYKAFYGQINAADVGKWWVQHKNKLFDQNIREFLGDSDVNEEMAKTLENAPELFWYFNNGITVLCQEISKVGAKKDRQRGEFNAKGISIVNGAQTIGCIGALYQDSSQELKEIIEDAEISIRFICLENCEEDFGEKVTRATNTQNKVESRDFVALDSQQERLSREFKTCGKKYHYKRTAETIERNDKNYELEEATVALACASRDVKLVMTAKQELSKLWSDPSQPPYTTLFNHHVHALQLYRQIDVKREVEAIIKNRQGKNSSKTEDALFKHGKLFVLHLVFQKIPKDIFSNDTSEKDFYIYNKNKLPELIQETIKRAEDYLKKNYKQGQLWHLFRNVKKLRGIQSFILKNT